VGIDLVTIPVPADTAEVDTLPARRPRLPPGFWPKAGFGGAAFVARFLL
jgi:hypothetical protein